MYFIGRLGANPKSPINCLAYIDLNPIRAGLVDRPEEYGWSCLVYRFRSSRKDDFLSWNPRLKEYNVKNPKERLRQYRKFVRQGFKLFRDIIQPKRERKPYRIKGLEQINSMKRLSA